MNDRAINIRLHNMLFAGNQTRNAYIHRKYGDGDNRIKPR